MVENAVVLCAEMLLAVDRHRNPQSFTERFRSHFGTNLTITCKLWLCIQDKLHENAGTQHLLLTLYFLRVYPTEEVLVRLHKHPEKLGGNGYFRFKGYCINKICKCNYTNATKNLTNIFFSYSGVKDSVIMVLKES